MEREIYSFNDIPNVLGLIVNQIELLNLKVDQISIPQVVTGDKEIMMNAKALCKYLPNHPSLGTIYKWTCEKNIPFHKRGKNIVFVKSEIDAWLLAQPVKTKEQIRAEAHEEFNKRFNNK